MNKESGFRVRVVESLRKEFLEACRMDDTTASQEIRRFMRDYVGKRGTKLQADLFSESVSDNDQRTNR